MKKLALLVAAFIAFAFVNQASAAVDVVVGLGRPAVVVAAPVVTQAAPVAAPVYYYRTRPVYVRERVVYVAPAPAPVYVAPAPRPVYVVPAPVVRPRVFVEVR